MSEISPTAFTRALVEAALPESVRLGLDMPEPEWLAPEAGRYPVYGQLYMLDGWRDRHEQHPEMEIAFFSRRFLRAEQVALAVERFLVRYPVRVQVGGRAAVLDQTIVTASTREVPWEAETAVTRFIGSYELRTRS